jgi:LCP family protein required for cell wall assembly
MANSRRPDDGSRRSRRGQESSLSGLEALGKQMPGGAPIGAGVGSRRSGRDGGRVANESGLSALGAQIDGKGKIKGARDRGLRRSGKARWSRRRKVVTILSSVVLLIVAVAGASFGYLDHEFGLIKKGKCSNCVAVANGAPFNVLLIGSDSRVGETAAEAKEFGNQTEAGGQRSDTIKIIHVDPKTGTASTLSIPRDTLVTLSDVPSASGVSNPNKINSAFATGPNAKNPAATGADGLVKTIENTFGIPISHWIVINFFGLMDMVNALHDISMDVPYPVRDLGGCGLDGSYTNCSGLNITTIGCQPLNGAAALSLSRSRDFEYYKNGEWQSDPTGDIGRIERQNLIIEAVVDKAKSTYNPFTVSSFISSLAHDVTLDDNLGPSLLISLAERYHALSGSALNSYTLPTVAASYEPYGGEAVETVQEPAASQVIATFLGAAPNQAVTPPLDQYGDPETVTATAPTTAAPTTSGSGSKSSSTTPAPATDGAPSYDPKPC